MVCFVTTHPLDSDLFGGWRYQPFEQPGPKVLVYSNVRASKNLTFDKVLTQQGVLFVIK